MSDLFNTGIRPAIDEYLKKKQEEERNYGDYWSASSAGYCMRLNIMRRLKIPKVPELEDNATQTRIFEAGHIFHEWLQRITKDAGLSIASEVELQDEDLMIRGHFDDLVLIKDGTVGGNVYTEPGHEDVPLIKLRHNGSLILYDYKTAHSASFKFKKQQTNIGHYHKMQLGTYMYMLRSKKDGLNDWPWEGEGDLTNRPDNFDLRALTEARILSISKDDLRMDEKQLLWTPDLEKEVVGYWKTLNGYWEAKKLPRCTCADFDGGFMGRRSAKGKVYNDFFWQDEPCSIEWAKQHKELLKGWTYEAVRDM